jgi:hypothetical protein
MIGMQRGRIGGEQLLVLWTWLLQGYVPVAHMVADLDELEAVPANGSADTSRGRASQQAMQLAGSHAA